MVSVEEIEKVMREVFPRCPICGEDNGYSVSSFFKSRVQCKVCEAKWNNSGFGMIVETALDSGIDKLRLEEMALLETPNKGVFAGKFSELRNKQRPIRFWYELNKEISEYSEEDSSRFKPQKPIERYEKLYNEALAKEQILVSSEMSDKDLLKGIKKNQVEFAFYFNQLTGGKGWDILHTLFSSGSGLERRQMWMTLSMINQNSVLIRQNEMIRRLLEKIEKSSYTNDNLESD